MSEDKVRENRLRRQAKRLGLELKKSRAQRLHIDDRGGYGIIDPAKDKVVFGERFDLSLDDAETWLDGYEKRLTK